MNAVGIDVSKGKSMVSIMRPFGEIVASPFEVSHTAIELGQLASRLKTLDGETRIVMENTGNYCQPIARFLHEEELFVSVVHAQLVHNFGNNSIRRVKTDKADAVKIAAYGLTHWLSLPKFTPEEDIRQMLKAYSRQYDKYIKLKTALKNNIISLLDQTFPGVNTLFTSPARKSDGHQKWLDFAGKFWHCECVCSLSPKAFTQIYRKWCSKAGYRFSESTAFDIYAASCGHVNVMPRTDTVELLIKQAVIQINAIGESLAVITREMIRLASTLPEYPIVLKFNGVGELLASQLISEIGDVYRFTNKKQLVCFAGLDAPPYQSGKFESRSRSISKKGSPHLRKTLFLVVGGLLKHAPQGDAVFEFLDRKRAEGKHYYVYMTAAAAKFLRVYYGRVKEFLDKQQAEI
jgi:transposase